MVRRPPREKKIKTPQGRGYSVRVAHSEYGWCAASVGELSHYYYVTLALPAGKHLEKSGPPAQITPKTCNHCGAATCASKLFLGLMELSLLFFTGRFVIIWCQNLTRKIPILILEKDLPFIKVESGNIFSHCFVFCCCCYHRGVHFSHTPRATALSRKRWRGRTDRRARRAAAVTSRSSSRPRWVDDVEVAG